jgi:RNA polymerase sigma-70 factor (ECF subfamily)
MTQDPEELLRQARSEQEGALGALLELYRHYLALLARRQIGQRLQGKVDASDIVQETFLEAHRHFANFRGTEEPQLLAWLREILAGKVANLVRHYFGTQGRNVRLEEDLVVELNDSARFFGKELVGSLTSPSVQAARREETVLLADALAQLPEHYREVLILRHLEELTFPEIAQRMQRTQDSVEKLWLRGLAQLRQIFVGGKP